MKRVAQFLTGFDSVVLGLIIFVGYRYFEVQFLFYNYLPLDENVRTLASGLVSVVVVFSLLVFSSHLDRFKISKDDSGEWIKWVMFIFTLFINAYFWEVWNPKIIPGKEIRFPFLSYAFKATISVFFAIFDFAYNHLFISRWNERAELGKVHSNIEQLNAQLSEGKQELSQVEQSLSDYVAKLSQLIARDDPKVCPRCGQEFENSNQRNGHLRSCSSSPELIKSITPKSK